MGRLRLNNAASLVALLAAGAIALTACSSSGGGSGTSAASSGTPSTSGASTGMSTSGGGTSAAGITCFSGKLNAAGSTAQTNAMTAWISAFQKACPSATINYASTGSGDGITEISNAQVQFAGSDAALNASKGEVSSATTGCGSAPIDLPMVGGPIAIGYKLSGFNGQITLDAATIAKMFLGKITTWNDPAIAALNKGVTLPSTKITPFYRSDSSGTTINFESFLSANAKSVFTATPDKDSSTAHFAGQGKSGSQGVAESVSQTDGGIGYFEYSYAVSSGLSTINVDQGAGGVAVSPDAASLAIAEAKIIGKSPDLSLQLNYAANSKGAYPVALVTYEIACSKYKSASDATKVKDFLNYIVGSGQTQLKSLGYAPLPASLAAKVKASIATIQ